MAQKLLTRDQILGADDLPTETVEAWGGLLMLRGLSVKQYDEFVSESLVKKGKREYDVKMIGMQARLVARTAINEKGERLFSDEDVEALSRKSAAELNRVAKVAQRLSGLTEEDLEDIEKNSVSILNGNSSSV